MVERRSIGNQFDSAVIWVQIPIQVFGKKEQMKSITVNKSQMNEMLRSVNLYFEARKYLANKIAGNESNESELAEKVRKYSDDPYSFLMQYLGLNTDIKWCIVDWEDGKKEICSERTLIHTAMKNN